VGGKVVNFLQLAQQEVVCLLLAEAVELLMAQE
jgi:hypothetical protein